MGRVPLWTMSISWGLKDILIAVSCKQLDLGIQDPRGDHTGDSAS